MISSWALWIIPAMLGLAALGAGIWRLAWHSGYSRGLGERIGLLPGDAWQSPPSEAEFMSELLDGERRRPDKYHEGK